jgi:hypothetical protein
VNVEHRLDTWESELKQHDKPHSLISVAREGRLVREGARGSLRVHISPVDECVLTLVDLAHSKHRDIAFLYPAPAGDVAVLLAAQVLVQALIQHVLSPSVGIVTADAVAAGRAWNELRIASGATRTALSEVFPCLRAAPDGKSPFGRHPFQGVLLGSRFSEWPVDLAIVDHLAGFVVGNCSVPTVHIFADPLDAALEVMVAAGELAWGFAPSEISAEAATTPDARLLLAPFSVAEDRLRVIVQGMRANIEVVHHGEAEQCASRIRDDLHTLTDLCGPSPAPLLAKGLRVAYHHFTALMGLPCKPSLFDRFAGLPPIAARATETFEPEITAWARMLRGDAAEYGSVLASDLGELRAILEDCNLFHPRIAVAIARDTETVCVVRTHTAARALMQALGGNPDEDCLGRLHVRSIRRLHREGSWPSAITVGLLPRWEWHQVDSGLASDVTLLVLGVTEFRITRAMLAELALARKRWASPEVRGPAFRELLGINPPAQEVADHPIAIAVTTVEEESEVTDPLAQLGRLGMSTPLLIAEEDVEEIVAQESEAGTWAAAVDAVDIRTDSGTITLPVDRSVEVRHGDKILDCLAEDLQPGMCLLVGRREGRLGLLEAVAGRLQRTRPDLFAASLLVSDLRTSVRNSFRSSRMSISELYERLTAQGFDKTYQAARGYVGDFGPLAPRDVGDLRLLNEVLQLGFSSRRIAEIFAGVQRLRVFRRAAGRALATAAREATVSSDVSRVDHDTGLSLADLREVVLEAEVLEVKRCPEPVLIGDLGRLKAEQ